MHQELKLLYRPGERLEPVVVDQPLTTAKDVLQLAIERAEIAFKVAAAKAIDEHTRLGLPVYIWRDRKVVKFSPSRNAARGRPENGKCEGCASLHVIYLFRLKSREGSLDTRKVPHQRAD